MPEGREPNPYAPPLSAIGPGDSSSPGPSSPIGGFGRRFAAILVDYLLVWGLAWVVLIGTSRVLGVPVPSLEAPALVRHLPRYIGVLIIVGIGLAYAASLEASPLQATLGKHILGLRVTDRRGRRLTFGRSTVRACAKLVSIVVYYLGFLPALADPKGRTFHDWAAGTLVVRGPAPAWVRLTGRRAKP